MTLPQLAVEFTERGIVPDGIARAGIRRLLRARLAEIGAGDPAESAERTEAFVGAMRAAPIALLPHLANEQHYELPCEFFGHVLGRHRKYSACLWREGVSDLDAAEACALEVTAERAGLADGQHILELGCGWGSLTLWMARRFPSAQITAVSNSHSQRAYIEGQVRRAGIANVRVLTGDVSAFEPGERYDRVVSVEMFEHLRNWSAMFARVAGWLAPGGRFFMHVFVHRSTPYAFEPRDDSDWMARHFFSGGMMPSDDLAVRFQDDLALVARWRWDGTHYARTAEAWLARMDARRDVVWPILEQAYGSASAALWWTRWRLFFISCAELFGYAQGREWWVAHYLFERRP